MGGGRGGRIPPGVNFRLECKFRSIHMLCFVKLFEFLADFPTFQIDHFPPKRNNKKCGVTNYTVNTAAYFDTKKVKLIIHKLI